MRIRIDWLKRRRISGYMRIIAAVLFCLVQGCATLSGDMQSRVLAAKRAVEPALVHIYPVKEVFLSGMRQEMLTVGSGFIISPDGYVVTNEHVAGESSLVLCLLSDNTEMEAKVVGVDPETDIAVLKLDTTAPLPFAMLGRSDTVEAGQLVLAMGSPHGLARSTSLGIVSVTNRYLGEESGLSSPYHTWIQTDAAINRGNSGGPLVNMKGEVIGINTLTLMGAENVGFAIPIDIAREVMDAIIAHGRVRRSRLGLNFQEMRAKTSDPSMQGVVISDVAPFSPAHEAGIRPGDVLITLNGVPVNARYEEELPAVRKRIADLPIGETVTLELIRGEEQLTVVVTTEEQLSSKGARAEFAEWGFTATEITQEIARRAQLVGRGGVLISGCRPGGIAAVAGLIPGDIVLKVDDEEIHSFSDFKRIYDELVRSNKDLVMLFVQRGAVTRFVLINNKKFSETHLEQEISEYAN